MLPKEPAHPCLRCKKNVGKVKAVQCATCKLWVHTACEEMSDDLYNVLSAKFGGVMWHCVNCLASTARLDASIKAMEMRLLNVESKVEAVEDRTQLMEVRVDKVEMTARQAMQEAVGAKEDVANVVFEEMRDREEKKMNILLHNIEERRGTVEEARRWDEASFDNIMKELDVTSRYRDSTTFSRRIGAVREDRARPLLVGLKNEDVKNEILNNTRKLATGPLRLVSVVPDLTKRQRDQDD